jgi:hypothetical protein
MGRRWSLGHSGRFAANDINPIHLGSYGRRVCPRSDRIRCLYESRHSQSERGISVVEVDNGSFATYTALNLAALKVWNVRVRPGAR